MICKFISKKILLLDNSHYTLKETFHSGKSGYSQLFESETDKIIFKQFLEEKTSYIPFEEKLKTEINSYKKLQSLPINIPKLIHYDYDKHFLIKEFIDGELLAKRIAENKLDSKIIEEFYINLKKIYQAGYNIDYFPNNFVFNSNNELFYIDYEVQPYTDEWNFENWGIFYWLNSEGVSHYLETGSADKLNYPGEYKPIQYPELVKKINFILNNNSD